MGYSSRDKKPLKDIAIVDQDTISEIAALVSSETVDISGKVDKITGYSLVADTEIEKIHTSGSDNQDLSGLVVKETGKGLSTNDYTTEEKNKLAGLSNSGGMTQSQILTRQL